MDRIFFTFNVTYYKIYYFVTLAVKWLCLCSRRHPETANRHSKAEFRKFQKQKRYSEYPKDNISVVLE